MNNNNPFIYINDGGNFIEPIKNPFTCEGAYLQACKDVTGELEANKEVGNDVSNYIQMQNWLDKLAYEYI
jgi:hypothetical protein